MLEDLQLRQSPSIVEIQCRATGWVLAARPVELLRTAAVPPGGLGWPAMPHASAGLHGWLPSKWKTEKPKVVGSGREDSPQTTKDNTKYHRKHSQTLKHGLLWRIVGYIIGKKQKHQRTEKGTQP